MGRGLVYRCPNCGKEYHVLVGSGFVFPEVYRETLLRVLNGEYGVRLQNEIKTSPFAAIDAEYHLLGNRFWIVGISTEKYRRNTQYSLRRKNCS